MNTIICLTTLKFRGHPTTRCLQFGFIVKYVQKLKRREGGNINVKIKFLSPLGGFNFAAVRVSRLRGFSAL